MSVYEYSHLRLAIQEALKQGDEDEAARLTTEWREQIKNRVPAVYDKLQHLNTDAPRLESVNKRYRDSISLYREVDNLLKEVRLLKKGIREEMRQRRTKTR